MAQPTFWDNPEKARGVIGQLKPLNGLLNPYESLSASCEDLRALAELCEEDDSLEGELNRFDNDADPVLKQSVRAARRRLRGEMVPAQVQEPTPAAMELGVGTG